MSIENVGIQSAINTARRVDWEGKPLKPLPAPPLTKEEGRRNILAARKAGRLP